MVAQQYHGHAWSAERDRRRSTVCSWFLRERLRRVDWHNQRPVLVCWIEEALLKRKPGQFTAAGLLAGPGRFASASFGLSSPSTSLRTGSVETALTLEFQTMPRDYNFWSYPRNFAEHYKVACPSTVPSQSLHQNNHAGAKLLFARVAQRKALSVKIDVGLKCICGRVVSLLCG